MIFWKSYFYYQWIELDQNTIYVCNNKKVEL